MSKSIDRGTRVGVRDARAYKIIFKRRELFQARTLQMVHSLPHFYSLYGLPYVQVCWDITYGHHWLLCFRKPISVVKNSKEFLDCSNKESCESWVSKVTKKQQHKQKHNKSPIIWKLHRFDFDHQPDELFTVSDLWSKCESPDTHSNQMNGTSEESAKGDLANLDLAYLISYAGL